MIVQLVDTKQSHLGYTINNVFYPYDFINSVVKGELPCDKTEFAKQTPYGVVTQNQMYHYVSDYLESLKSQNLSIDFNDISFIERKPTDDELYDLSSFWKISKCTTRYVYTIVDNKLSTLGYFITNKNIYTACDCYLAMIEILDKNRGIGTSVVSKLLKLTSIQGISCVTARDFWARNGAVFSKDNRFKILREI